MKLSIRSLGGLVKDYEPFIGGKVDYFKHYNITHDEIRKDGYGKDYHFISDELKDVEVETLEELFEIFKPLSEFYAGQITVDVHNNIVWILDSWIE